MRGGETRRSVAKAVFGDEGLKGRVDRIVRDDALNGRRDDIERLLRTIRDTSEDPNADSSDDDVPALEDLFPLYARALQRRLEDPQEWVTAGELETFARLEYRIENKRTVERLNRIARGEADEQPEEETAA